ncbi:DsbA family protein [Paenisporosarcina quisquiliarum]|uniref:ClpXP adapter protein SpxH n=1 Tax=Paenisporosarcina quisquiliarum TaxID=365346 RepID=A0A9X3LEM8_9BACL|nr:DsbA family protein [Paenisporosarcina quisquiliarum]
MNNLQIPPEAIVSTSSTKPIELYAFIDPLCSSCFDLQPILRKLQVEYEQYFTLRVVLSTKLSTLNSVCTDDSLDADDFTHPALPSVAIKAAELQGKRAGVRYLQKLQEQFFLDTKNVASFSNLLAIAEEAQLDVEEFKSDLQSKEATRAFQCDLHISREMEVNESPSMVFFNEHIEDEGLKVCGVYSYEVYEQILAEMLDMKLSRQEPPTLDELFQRYHTLSTKEVASIYGVTNYAAERELKKRTLLQQLERIPLADTNQWRLKSYMQKV